MAQTIQTKKKRGLLGSLFTISAWTLVSRILGLVRDIVFASFFGASAMMDAFNVAFRIPNLFRRFFGEGAFNQSFVPVFSEYYEKKRNQLPLFVAEVSGSLGIVLLAITALGILFAPELVTVFASGFKADPEKFALTADLVRIMIPYVFLICMLAMYSSILNSLDRFALPALLPSLLNIALIIGAFVSVEFLEIPIMGLGYAVLLAGILQCMIVMMSVRRQNLLTKMPRVAFGAPGVKQVIVLMVPALIGSSSSQINILINTQLASRLETGSVTWLYYSDRLVEFALGTVAVALGTVVLPKLSRLNALNDREGFEKTVNWGIRLALVLGVPSSIGLIILAEPLLALLFMRGAFTLYDVKMSALSLVTYGTSIVAYFLIKILAPVYYSRQDTKTPLKFGLVAIGVNIALQFVLVRYYAHAGLALSTSIAAWVNAMLLMMGLHHLGIYRIQRLWTGQLWVIVPANIMLGIFLYWVSTYQDFWFDSGLLPRLAALVVVMMVALVGYFATLHVLGFSVKQFKNVS